MTPKIRNVTIEDLKAVTAVEASCFPAAEAATRSAFAQRIKVFPESFFIAEMDHKIVGFINGGVINETTIGDELFQDADRHVPDGAYQTVFGLDVIPGYRNQGIAARLMEHLIAVSRSASRKGVILTCKASLIDYYQKFGFENSGESQSVHGGSKWYDMILRFDSPQ
ncbi:MAG: GNAT family N-acetyltransferase [Acetobacterium sp. MES1]|uniref:GNAT family N-acetyltransferase n=1 Tax=Acetobacterium sp. MES1 TaxID=1899015 RepID=UPI000B9CDD87|nr:GNAT family N-acetyltransferase [Acetobacterium sp. MES1]OXS25632.1 MAG: GNAT family N-acetyltransferase [Acetobacterium sp. MES1]